MVRGKRLSVVIVWVLSLIIVAGFAQAEKKPRPVPPARLILSGNDIGFSVYSRNSDRDRKWVVATLVVKTTVNGYRLLLIGV